MPDSITKELEHGWQVFNEGKAEDALQIVSEIEKIEGLTPVETLKCQILKGVGFLWTGNFKSALTIGKHVQKEGVKLGKPFLSIEAIALFKFGALWFLGRQFEIWKDIEYCEKLLKSAPQAPSSEFEQAEVLFKLTRGYFAFWEGKLDRVLEDYTESLPFLKQSTHLSFTMHSVLNVMGATYALKGELDRGLKYLMRSLDVSKGMFLNKTIDAGNLNWIAKIYIQQGKLNLAAEYFEKSLEIWEQFNDPIAISFINSNYSELIKVCLYQDSQERAKEYLYKFKLFLEKSKIPLLDYGYQLSNARTLRSSPRTRDLAEAEKILKELIIRYDALKESGLRGIADENPETVIELCDLFLEELYSTHDLGILDEIQPLINRLIKASENLNSYSLLAHTNLLQGKVSLLQMNMGDARRYLTQAQDIAEDHGLQLLAQAISKEHDKLLEQLDKLENIEKLDMTLSERLDLASLDKIIARMQGKRAIKTPEVVNEEPILLLIITEGGVPVFSYSFADEWNQEDELFASFLSAITSFSSELFSEGLDRIKFGHYTVLMKPMTELSSCYLFKGQSYLAKQKLTRFTKGIQNNTSVMQTLTNFYHTSQVVELKDFPFLEVYIKDIFVSKF